VKAEPGIDTDGLGPPPSGSLAPRTGSRCRICGDL